jgi:hypothetical protein
MVMRRSQCAEGIEEEEEEEEEEEQDGETKTRRPGKRTRAARVDSAGEGPAWRKV